MLVLYDTAHNKLCGLSNYSDYYIEKAIGSGSTPIVLDQLHFKYPIEDINDALIDYECYISNGDAEFVVKEINLQTADGDAAGPTWAEYVCDANIEPIKGTRIDSYAPGSAQAADAANLALAGTGWVVGYCDVTKTRTVAPLTQTTVWDALNAIASMYNCDITFDTINKTVIIHQKIGTDRGAYFAEQLNLKTLQVQGNSRSIVTRLYPRGKDGMTIAPVNNGVEYVSNYQYMTKVVEAYWTDNRYIVPEDMLEDANDRINFLSMPTRAYSGAIIDLANASGGKYNLIAYDIGDTIMLLAESIGVREQQRIVKIDIYPDEPEKSTCEIANRIVSLDDIILRVSDAADAISDATDGDGNVLGSSVSVTNQDGTFDPLNVALTKIGTAIIGKLSVTDADIKYANIGDFTALSGTVTGKFTAYDGQFETIETNSETVNGMLTALDTRTASLETDNETINGQLTALNVTVTGKLSVADAALQYAKITDMDTVNGNINNLTTKLASITVATGDSWAVNKFAAGSITAGSGALAEASVGDANIVNMSLEKLLAGTISTNKFTVASDSGNLSISNNTMHVWDSNGKERVTLGLNGSDYNLTVRAADGQTTIFGATGVTNAGITSGAVDDSKIASNANINGSKIDMQSLATAVNNSTVTLNSSRILYDPTGQTLNVAFNSLSQTVGTQGTTLSSQGTSINTMQGQISNKIWQADITTAVNGISASSVNRVTGTSAPTSIVGNNTVDQAVTVYQIQQDAFGKQVTCSFDWSVSGNTAVYNATLRVQVNGLWTALSPSISLNITSGSGHSVLVLTLPSSTATPAVFIRLDHVNGGTVTINNFRIVSGNKESDWSPAPEDTATAITSNSTNFNQLATGLGWNATNSTFTNANGSLSYRMSQAEQQITPASIVSTVTSSTSWSALNSMVNSKSRTFTSQPTPPYSIGDIWTNPSGDTMVCTTARATGSYIASDWGYTSSITTSTITQLSNNINLKVNSNGVIAAINLSPESVSINASKINLTGYVTATALQTGTVFANQLSTVGSAVYGTIGDISSDKKTGFVLRKTSDNSNLLRIASGAYGDDGSPATVIDVNGALTIKSDISTTGSGASMFLFDGFSVSTNTSVNHFNFDQYGFNLYFNQYSSTQISPNGNSTLIINNALVTNQNGYGGGSIYLCSNDGVQITNQAHNAFVNVNCGGLTSHAVDIIASGANVQGNGFYRASDSYWAICSDNVKTIRWSGSAFNFYDYGSGLWWVYADGASDERLKSNIVPSTADALNTIRNIHMIDYTLNEDGSHVMCGVSAQDLMSHNNKFGRVFLTRDGTDYYSPNWDALHPYTLKAVQQLASKSDDTDSKIASLKAQIQALQSQISDLYGKVA
ncbi:MAG: phage tail spike protein [Ethanoligenens sp.]